MRRILYYKNKAFFFCLLIISFFFFSAFMFQSPSLRLRRLGHFPIIKVQINTDSSSIGLSSLEWKRIIEESATAWFQYGDAKGSLVIEGETNSGYPLMPASIDCSDTTKEFLQNSKDSVYIASMNDPDCTGSACSFILSCGDEIQHVDIQVNPDVGSTADNISNTLRKLLVHEFGHALGLDHCASGDTVVQCGAKQNFAIPTIEPTGLSFMQKFYDSADFNYPQADDQAGLKKLYGEFINPFPKTGLYALNAAEIKMHSTMENQELSIAHLIASPERQVESYADLMTFQDPTPDQIDQEINAWAVKNGISPAPSGQEIDLNYTPPKLTRAQGIERDRAEMNAFFGNMQTFIPQLNDYQLSVLRMNSVAAIRAHSILKDALSANPKIDAGLIQQNLDWHFRIRQSVIDEQLKR